MLAICHAASLNDQVNSISATAIIAATTARKVRVPFVPIVHIARPCTSMAPPKLFHQRRRSSTDQGKPPRPPRPFFGSLWSHRKTRGPRDRAPSAYLQFSFFVFRLADPLFKGSRECGASIWLQ
jgi:hypothetical protein